MIAFRLRYCKRHMVAYINREVSPRIRSRISRYIDQSPACYAEYTRQRDTQRELIGGLSTMGRPSDQQLAQIWVGIERDMSQKSSMPKCGMGAFKLSYGIVALAVLTVLVLPLALGGENVPTTVAQPVLARQVAEVTTPNITEAVATPEAVAVSGEQPMTAQATEHPVNDILPQAAITPSGDA